MALNVAFHLSTINDHGQLSCPKLLLLYAYLGYVLKYFYLQSVVVKEQTVVSTQKILRFQRKYEP